MTHTLKIYTSICKSRFLSLDNYYAINYRFRELELDFSENNFGLGLGPDLDWTGLDWGLRNWTRA